MKFDLIGVDPSNMIVLKNFFALLLKVHEHMSLALRNTVG